MPNSASLYAFFTIALWSFLAYLGARLNHLDPFLLVGIALSTSGLTGLINWHAWRVPLKTLGVGVAGIFGYHFLFFTALKLSPPVEANLLNYLWPLLIVLLSPVYLSGYVLRPHHIVGALTGLLGAGLILTKGHLGLDFANLPGYLSASAAAFVWASYSLLTKRLPPFPTRAVGAFCLLSGLLSLGAFFLSSPSLSPLFSLSRLDWFFLVLLGAGPMGLAFFSWDAALKRGDPRIIGSLAYLTPLTSTLVLYSLGGQPLSLISIVAMVLIISGAVLGSLDLFRGRNEIPAEHGQAEKSFPAV